MIKNKTISLKLSQVSLHKQLIIIFSVIVLLIITILVPLINNNLTAVIDNEMFQTLDYSQSRYIMYDYSPIEKTRDKQIYHMKYDNQLNTLLPSSNLSSKEALIMWEVFHDDLFTMIKKGKERVKKKSHLDGETLYYQISKKDNNTYIISLVYSDYSSSLILAVRQQIINILYISIIIIAAILFIWVNSLIKPLRLIRNYIEDIRKDNYSELIIDRGDEIGIVSNELIAMKEEIDKQSKIKEEMIHNISHDLKTPIALIKSYSQSVKDDIYPYGDKNSSMDVIIENAERLDNKVRSLLYLNRLDVIKGEDINSKVDMYELISHIVNQLQGMYPQIEMHFELKKVYFKGDEEYWRICIENIFENAYRYVNKKIKIVLKEDYLEIYNDGEPIENDNIDALFQPYEKGTKGQFGLGLAIVKKTCNMYGYDVKAINQEIGVSFIISRRYID